MTILVGVDAGASHTEAVAADGSLTPRARHHGPGGAVRPTQVADAARVIAGTVHGALAAARLGPTPDAVGVGAAGAGRETERRNLEAALGEIFGPATKLCVTTDGAVALEAAFGSGVGIVVNAGSGAIAYARSPDGGVWRVGGLGWQFGDDGSGYALGRAALGVVARAADGRGPPTMLTARLMAAVGADGLDAMVRWSQAAAPHEVAGLAWEVCRTAEAGDTAACDLVRQTAADLLSHVRVLARRFGNAGTVPLALCGRLLESGSPVRTALAAMVRLELPQVEIREGSVDPPIGALALAARLVSGGGG